MLYRNSFNLEADVAVFATSGNLHTSSGGTLWTLTRKLFDYRGWRKPSVSRHGLCLERCCPGTFPSTLVSHSGEKMGREVPDGGELERRMVRGQRKKGVRGLRS